MELAQVSPKTTDEKKPRPQRRQQFYSLVPASLSFDADISCRLAVIGGNLPASFKFSPSPNRVLQFRSRDFDSLPKRLRDWILQFGRSDRVGIVREISHICSTTTFVYPGQDRGWFFLEKSLACRNGTSSLMRFIAPHLHTILRCSVLAITKSLCRRPDNMFMAQ